MTDPIKEHICPAVSDIVERLRQSHQYSGIQCKGCLAGADEIERLRAINADLLEALREIEVICTESPSACRKRMGTRPGNALVTARAAIKQIEERAS